MTAPTDTSFVGRFLWHDLVTTDEAAARAFYTSVAPWTIAVWEGAGSPYHMWMVGDRGIGGMETLAAEAAAQGTPPHWRGYIGCADVDATVRQAAALGGTVLVPPSDIPTVGRFAIVADPYGAVFAPYTPSSAPPAPEGAAGVGEFSWYELATRDLDGALAFYGALFGWTLDSDMEMGEVGTYRVFSRNGVMMGGMYVIPPDMPMTPSWLHYIRVADIHAAAAATTAAGGTMIQPPMEIPGGMIFMATDPQGAMFAAHWSAS